MSPSLLTRQAAQNALARVVRAALDHSVPEDHRRDLGLAATWLEGLLDHDVLPDAGFDAHAAGMHRVRRGRWAHAAGEESY
jgi:hypothetical protein